MKINWKEIKLKNRVLLEFISENYIIVLILISFATLGYWIWQSSESLKDFGQNFLSEMLGVLITVLIINQLIVLREEKRKIPHKFVLYEDLKSFLSNFLLFWKKAYRASVPEDEPESLQEFFSDEGMGKIWDNLYIKAKFKDNPALTWAEYITEKTNEFKTQVDKILMRHTEYLPPHIYRMLHSLIESRFIYVLSNISSTMNYLENINNPRINSLEAVAMVKPTNREYSSIIALYDWCMELNNELKMYDNTIDELIEYKPRTLNSHKTYAEIPKNVKTKEKSDWRSFIKKS